MRAISSLFVGTSPQRADLAAAWAMDMPNTFGANSPEVNSRDVTGYASTKPRTVNDTLLYELCQMVSLPRTLSPWLVVCPLSFHLVAGGVMRQYDLFSCCSQHR